MRHISILLLKFITCLIAFAVGLDLFFDATIVDIISFSLLVTIVSYAIGDRIILPRLGNSNALAIDFFLNYTMVWIFGSVLLESYVQIGWGSLLSAFLITGAEVIVHRILLKNTDVTVQQKAGFNPKMAYGMEMGEERDPRVKR
ncbi:YndM family protein [Pseudoneobacillus rhizosphaerae]|uniref:DUF2512 family protein n=1 Tax=Pseudoneobacillus rhizosphaerae TaxID=2880968 RepID=A0A9C7GA39_9BACI|nr:YndM family protein [Pseudoneobacillus rhizosphaerae]CAG9608764.1 hypothetical protein NEOCIP111885_02481 [Pseudoneobacillus rhizosphaerae]